MRMKQWLSIATWRIEFQAQVGPSAGKSLTGGWCAICPGETPDALEVAEELVDEYFQDVHPSTGGRVTGQADIGQRMGGDTKAQW